MQSMFYRSENIYLNKSFFFRLNQNEMTVTVHDSSISDKQNCCFSNSLKAQKYAIFL